MFIVFVKFMTEPVEDVDVKTYSPSKVGKNISVEKSTFTIGLWKPLYIFTLKCICSGYAL